MEDELYVELADQFGRLRRIPLNRDFAGPVLVSEIDARAKEQAFARALALFESLLSRWQLTEFRGNGTVSVTGSCGSLFRIRCRSDYLPYNVLNLTTGQRWCFYLNNSNRFPYPDHWAAQLLTLRTNERRARMIAYKQPNHPVVIRAHGAV